MKQVLTHIWQEIGLGTAPFSLVSIVEIPTATENMNIQAYNLALEETGQIAKAFGVHFGTCQACGQGLKYNAIIRDAKNKHFIVGCDCAQKTNDSKLIGAIELENKKRARIIRAEKAKAKREAKRKEIEAQLNLERSRNGGLTDWELLRKQESDRHEKIMAQKIKDRKWILDVLKNRNAQEGGFIWSIIRQLETMEKVTFSERAEAILADIYGKNYGRSNSKAYDRAIAEFYRKIGSI